MSLMQIKVGILHFAVGNFASLNLPTEFYKIKSHITLEFVGNNQTFEYNKAKYFNEELFIFIISFSFILIYNSL